MKKRTKMIILRQVPTCIYFYFVIVLIKTEVKWRGQNISSVVSCFILSSARVNVAWVAQTEMFFFTINPLMTQAFALCKALFPCKSPTWKVELLEIWRMFDAGFSWCLLWTNSTSWWCTTTGGGGVVTLPLNQSSKSQETQTQPNDTCQNFKHFGILK